MKNVTLLALDTATEACSVALLRGGEKTHLAQFAQREHTKHILPMVDEILAQAGIMPWFSVVARVALPVCALVQVLRKA